MSRIQGSDRRRRAGAVLVMIGLGTLVIAGAVVARLAWLSEGLADGAAPSRGGSTSGTRPLISWAGVGGVQLPLSGKDGPGQVSMGRSFSQREAGAALAAVHFLIRTSATSGPAIYGPTLANGVTGSNAAAMRLLVARQYEQLRARYGVVEGRPIPGGDAQVAGFRILSSHPGDATVEVLLSSPDLATDNQLVGFNVRLQWAGNDWKLVAPPGGDWGAVATTYATRPADLVEYAGPS